MSKSRGSPRKFSEKIALLEKKGAETNAAFERIIKEVEQTTRAPLQPNWRQPGRISTSWLDVSYSANEADFASSNDFHMNPRQFNQQQQTNQVSSFTCLDAPEQSVDTGWLHQRASSFSFSNHDHLHRDQQPLTSLPVPQQARTAPPYLDDCSSNGRLAQVNVPNIEISTVDDAGNFIHCDDQTIDSCNYQQQQANQRLSSASTPTTTTITHNHDPLSRANSHQQHHHHLDTLSFNNECSIGADASISAARSLPDIANLRVEGEYSASSNMGPAHSEQGIPNGSYNYDNNCNIILQDDSTSTVLSAQGSYCSLNISPEMSPRSQRNSLTGAFEQHAAMMPRLSQSTQGLNTIVGEADCATSLDNSWQMDNILNNNLHLHHHHSQTLIPNQSVYIQRGSFQELSLSQQQMLHHHQHHHHNHQQQQQQQSQYYDQSNFDQIGYSGDLASHHHQQEPEFSAL